jgi:pimeloyl-ACP methyl ester carboxylesterase
MVRGRAAVYGVVGDGPPVVFLHGWSLGCGSYRRCLTALAQPGRRVFAPSLPGFGGTADLAEESIGGYAAWVAAFIRNVCPSAGPLPLVGHSFGGGVGIRTAHDFPDLVGRLVVINSIGGAQWRADGDLVQVVGERPIWDWGLHLASDLIAPWRLAQLARVVGADVAANLLRNPAALWRVGRLAARTDLSSELAALKTRGTPMVIVWGHGDRFLPRLALQSLRDVTDAACHTVDGHHTWLLTQPHTFCEVITNLLDPADSRPRHRTRALLGPTPAPSAGRPAQPGLPRSG